MADFADELMPYKEDKTLNDVCVLLQQIIDIISIPTNVGVTVGGIENEGRPHGVSGQVIPSGVSNTLHVS